MMARPANRGAAPGEECVLRGPPGIEIFGGIEISRHCAAAHFAGERELQVVAGTVLENVAADTDVVAIDRSTQVAPYEIA
jgi:hypothetical protein